MRQESKEIDLLRKGQNNSTFSVMLFSIISFEKDWEDFRKGLLSPSSLRSNEMYLNARNRLYIYLVSNNDVKNEQNLAKKGDLF